MATYEKKVKKLLKDNNWYKSRQGRSSHEQWRNDDLGKEVTVPSKIKSRHTANEILKQAKIPGKVKFIRGTLRGQFTYISLTPFRGTSLSAVKGPACNA